MKKYAPSLKVLILAVIMAAGVNYLFAWSGPSSAPPGGNVPAPINVSSSTQAKLGLLGVNGLQVNPGGTSNVAVGAQMIASDNYGDVQWVSPASSSAETGWVNIDSGGTNITDYYQYNTTASNTGIAYHNPENMCKRAGYSHFTGACMGSTTSGYNGFSGTYYGTITENGNANPDISCLNGQQTQYSWADANTEIMCSK